MNENGKKHITLHLHDGKIWLEEKFFVSSWWCC